MNRSTHTRNGVGGEGVKRSLCSLQGRSQTVLWNGMLATDLVLRLSYLYWIRTVSLPFERGADQRGELFDFTEIYILAEWAILHWQHYLMNLNM